MAGDHDGHAFVGQHADAVPEFPPGQRIDAGGRLVEKQDVGRVQQRCGQRQPLLEPEGQVVRHGIGQAAEFEPLQRAIDGARPGGAVQAIDAGEEAQVLPHRQFGIEREALRHVADPRARSGGCVQHVHAGDPGAAAGRGQQTAQHAEDGGLAGTVRPQQPEDFPPLHGEADMVHGDERAEATHQVVHLDGGGCGSRRLPLPLWA